MEHTTSLAIKLLAPSIAAVFAAGVMVLAGWNLSTSPLLVDIATAWERIADALFIVAAVLLIHGAFRLWQWTQGRTLDCPNCGGPLGREREGRYAAYRKCLGCGKNIARINYA